MWHPRQEIRLYLAENKNLRLTTLCGLYVAQGIPWGFVTVTFAAWLSSPQNGMTAEQIGPVLAVATLPWSFKFLWGPLMDRFTIPSLGRRRPWIIFAQGMAILVLASMLLAKDPAGMVWTAEANSSAIERTLLGFIPGPLAGLVLLANIFVSMQDVAVDALAVDLLDESERATANGLMYGSSYLGTAIGGAGLGYVVAVFGIQAGLICQAVLLSAIMLLPVFFRERRDDGNEEPAPPLNSDADSEPSPDTANPYASSHQNRSESVFGNLLKAFSLKSTIMAAILALGGRLGIGVLTTVFVDYLLKDGGWSQEQYTAVTGGWAVLLGLCGSVAGGFIADRIGAKTLITVSSITLGAIWVAFGVAPAAIKSHSLVTALLLAQETLLATITVSLFALYMGISWPKVAATQFTAYMALSNLSTTLGSYAAGVLSRSFSIFQILIVAGVLQILILLPLAFIDPHQTRRELGSG